MFQFSVHFVLTFVNVFYTLEKIRDKQRKRMNFNLGLENFYKLSSGYFRKINIFYLMKKGLRDFLSLMNKLKKIYIYKTVLSINFELKQNCLLFLCV